MSTKSTSDTLDIANEVLGFLEVDPSLSTEAEDEVLLISTGI